MKFKPGDKIPPLELRTVQGTTIQVPNTGSRFVHMQFRRYAGCPICNTHLRAFVKRIDDLKTAGVAEVVFFHASASEMKKYLSDLPFDFVADREKRYYKQFGVETSMMAAFSPSAMVAGLRGIAHGVLTPNMEGGPNGLPADILVDAAGTIVALKYGKHANDQWSAEQLLTLVATL
jgi:peroxiredoxin